MYSDPAVQDLHLYLIQLSGEPSIVKILPGHIYLQRLIYDDSTVFASSSHSSLCDEMSPVASTNPFLHAGTYQLSRQ